MGLARSPEHRRPRKSRHRLAPCLAQVGALGAHSGTKLRTTLSPDFDKLLSHNLRRQLRSHMQAHGDAPVDISHALRARLRQHVLLSWRRRVAYTNKEAHEHDGGAKERVWAERRGRALNTSPSHTRSCTRRPPWPRSFFPMSIQLVAQPKTPCMPSSQAIFTDVSSNSSTWLGGPCAPVCVTRQARARRGMRGAARARGGPAHSTIAGRLAHSRCAPSGCANSPVVNKAKLVRTARIPQRRLVRGPPRDWIHTFALRAGS